MEKAKVRGQQRKLRCLLKNIEEFKAFQQSEQCCEHFHVPSGQFIESPKASGRIKTEFAKAWIHKTEAIIAQKPNGLRYSKIVTMINDPYFWDSQIIIFYDEEYYKSFWDRNGPEQTWEITKHMSFIKQRNISTILPELSIKETILNEDFTRKSTLWFYGELPEKLR